MDNSLLSMNLEENFVYHEALTDSDNAVKDLARLLALGVESEEVVEENGDVVKSAAPIIDKCWEVIYPQIDRSNFPEVEDWNNLSPEEYKKVTSGKISKITDTVILKTKTIPKEITVNNSTAMGVNEDLNKDSIEMYLEIYMPPYLCDSEAEDPLRQRTEGYIPQVNDVNGIATGNTRVARNYHHLFMRIFDNLNEGGNGPAENVIDSVTRDVIKWNSRTSCWSKLSWYTDFEDKFKAPLIGEEARGMQDGTVRLPVIAGLTSESKIKLWANVNASRVVLGVMGSPNVDFSDNRYLIGCAYIGQIDSFDFSINDTAGNFGLFCTSSTSPAMGKTEVKIRPSVPAVINGSTVTGGTTAGSGTKLSFQNGLQMFNPQTNYEVMAMEISSIPYDYNQVDGGSYWGARYIDSSTVKLYCTFNNQPIAVTYSDAKGNFIRRNIGIAQTVTISPSKVEVDNKDRKKVKITLTVEDLLKAFIGESETKAAMAGTGISFIYCYYTTGGYYGNTQDYHESTDILNIQYNFSYYTEYTVQTGGVKRDKFGNPVSAVLDTTYGKNTANGITDFSMYATFTKDYFQRHFFMFASTEEYMQKELYGKSSYTGEYFADRIKVVHSSEGPRGILSGMITIDTSSLYPFDELIVNKDFEKYQDKPEELYVYLPITAPYCPFANSPNGRHGIGILKEIKYKDPTTDDEVVKFAINEIDRKYSDLKYVTEDFLLITSSKYGANISWKSSDETLIGLQDSTSGEMKIAKVHRPNFEQGKEYKVSLTATVSHGKEAATKEVVLELMVKMQGMTDSQAEVLDGQGLLISSPVKDNLSLPIKGKNNSNISWSSSNSAFIDNNGIVKRPNVGDKEVQVTLTATITRNDDKVGINKKFDLIVLPWTEDEEVQQAATLINWDLIKGNNTDSQAITDNLVLSSEVGRNVKVTWKLVSSTAASDSKTGLFDITTGSVTRPTYTQGPVTFQIKCILTKGDTSTKEVPLPPFIMAPMPITNKEIVGTAMTLLEGSVFLGQNTSLTQITTDMKLPSSLSYANASKASISWSLATVGTHTAVQSSPYIVISNVTDGNQATIKRPSSSDGNQSLALKATISAGADQDMFTDVKFFDITILAS